MRFAQNLIISFQILGNSKLYSIEAVVAAVAVDSSGLVCSSEKTDATAQGSTSTRRRSRRLNRK